MPTRGMGRQRKGEGQGNEAQDLLSWAGVVGWWECSDGLCLAGLTNHKHKNIDKIQIWSLMNYNDCIKHERSKTEKSSEMKLD